MNMLVPGGLWFDVETKRKTTVSTVNRREQWLWFDVETKRKTTFGGKAKARCGLWFDVETKRKTTLHMECNL